MFYAEADKMNKNHKMKGIEQASKPTEIKEQLFIKSLASVT